MNQGKPQGSVRIIAGEWRGRKIPVLDKPGLRPTGDRMRETLFNWLQGSIAGANVLDVFAGTGALGFEALSRGAAQATLLEKDPQLAGNLQQINTMLKGNAIIERADALQWLAQQKSAKYDVVFVDPPFAEGLHANVLQLLENVTHEGTMLYVEAPIREMVVIPPIWRVIKEAKTRDVASKLLQRAN